MQDFKEFMTQEKFEGCFVGNRSYLRKTVSKIMHAIFTKDELQSCSVTGMETAKPALPLNRQTVC